MAVVLLYTGGLSALQTASIASGLPITFLILFACYGLVKAFRVNARTRGVPEAERLKEAPSAAVANRGSD